MCRWVVKFHESQYIFDGADGPWWWQKRKQHRIKWLEFIFAQTIKSSGNRFIILSACHETWVCVCECLEREKTNNCCIDWTTFCSCGSSASLPFHTNQAHKQIKWKRRKKETRRKKLKIEWNLPAISFCLHEIKSWTKLKTAVAMRLQNERWIKKYSHKHTRARTEWKRERKTTMKREQIEWTDTKGRKQVNRKQVDWIGDGKGAVGGNTKSSKRKKKHTHNNNKRARTWKLLWARKRKTRARNFTLT